MAILEMTKRFYLRKEPVERVRSAATATLTTVKHHSEESQVFEDPLLSIEPLLTTGLFENPNTIKCFKLAVVLYENRKKQSKSLNGWRATETRREGCKKANKW